MIRALAIVALAATTAAAAPRAQPHLTPDGWGPVRIGMTRADVAEALGVVPRGEPVEPGGGCVEQISDAHPGMWFMFEDGRLTRISIGEQSRITTPHGIGIGATAAQVRKAYSRGLKAEVHHYEGRPAEYLTWWAIPKWRGLRFETDARRRVQTIHAGGPSIEYIEGCL